MTPAESRHREAQRWLGQARKDLPVARLLAGPEPSRWVLDSQQAAEKSAKAFLAFYDVAFRKTHDLTERNNALHWTLPSSTCSKMPQV